ncbi:MAG: hypothetical protein JXX14_10605 [Deltaproteobacteria bacterium]|nr:hypothetical protein [Deltaproteobacteria bacterium]
MTIDNQKTRLVQAGGKHDIIVPVGDNCEVGLQLYRAGFTRGSLLRFASSKLKNVVQLIEDDFKGAFENVLPRSPETVRCLKYDIRWHTRFDIRKENGQWVIPESNFKAQYPNELTKINFLIERLRTQLRGTQRLLFIYKSNVGDFEDIGAFIELIEKKYPQLPFSFLLVKTPQQTIGLTHSRLFVEDVQWLAPYTNALNGGNNKNWYRILGRYMKVDGLYRLGIRRKFRSTRPKSK